MIRRTLLAVAALAAANAILTRASRAAEAATPLAGDLIASGLTEAERARIAANLQREGLAIAGDIRRKGELLVVVAVQQGAPWRLVIDSRSGAIIGRRPLAEAATLSR